MHPKAIKAFRKRFKMTQADLAVSLEVDIDTISNWERGKPQEQEVLLILALRGLGLNLMHGELEDILSIYE